MINTNNEEKLFGVYNIEPVIGEKKAIIKHIDNIKLGPSQSISDECLDEIKLKDQLMGKIYGKIYKCNILHTFLLSSKKQPIFYLSVIYERSLRKFLLFKIYLYFSIESKVSCEKELINNELEGSFSLEVVIGDQSKELDKKIEYYPGFKKMKTIIYNFIKTNAMLELIDDLVNVHNKQLTDMYKENYSFSIPKPTISLDDYDEISEESEKEYAHTEAIAIEKEVNMEIN